MAAILNTITEVNNLLEDKEFSYSIIESDESFSVMGETYKKLEESSLSRIFHHCDNGFFTISAFRGKISKDSSGNLVYYETPDMKDLTELSEKEREAVNLKNTSLLKQDLTSRKLGYIPLIGGFYETDPTTGEKYKVEELSFFIPYQKEAYTPEEFKKIALTLAKKYYQDGVIIALPDENGKVEVTEYDHAENSWNYSVTYNLGEFTIDKMAEYYSRLKKGGSQTNIKYAFEGRLYASNAINAQSLSHKGVIPYWDGEGGYVEGKGFLNKRVLEKVTESSVRAIVNGKSPREVLL